jgi:hypothetical protein
LHSDIFFFKITLRQKANNTFWTKLKVKLNQSPLLHWCRRRTSAGRSSSGSARRPRTCCSRTVEPPESCCRLGWFGSENFNFLLVNLSINWLNVGYRFIAFVYREIVRRFIKFNHCYNWAWPSFYWSCLPFIECVDCSMDLVYRFIEFTHCLYWTWLSLYWMHPLNYWMCPWIWTSFYLNIIGHILSTFLILSLRLCSWKKTYYWIDFSIAI